MEKNTLHTSAEHVFIGVWAGCVWITGPAPVSSVLCSTEALQLKKHLLGPLLMGPLLMAPPHRGGPVSFPVPLGLDPCINYYLIATPLKLQFIYITPAMYMAGSWNLDDEQDSGGVTPPVCHGTQPGAGYLALRLPVRCH